MRFPVRNLLTVVPAAPLSGEQCEFILAGVLFRHRLPNMVRDVWVCLEEPVQGQFEDLKDGLVLIDS